MEAVALEFPSVRVIASEIKRGPGGARHLMLKEAGNPWVATFDDDSFPDDLGFFAQVGRSIARFPTAAVITGDNLPDEKVAEGCQRIAVFSGCGCVFNRAWYLRTRGFVPRVVAYGFEEVDVSLQLHALGGVIVLDPLLRVIHDHPLPERFPDDIVAGTVMNSFLFPLTRYPLALWPLGLAQGAKYALRIIRAGRGSSVIQALAGLPAAIRSTWPYRSAVTTRAVLGWLKLRRNPCPMPS